MASVHIENMSSTAFKLELQRGKKQSASYNISRQCPPGILPIQCPHWLSIHNDVKRMSYCLKQSSPVPPTHQRYQHDDYKRSEASASFHRTHSRTIALLSPEAVPKILFRSTEQKIKPTKRTTPPSLTQAVTTAPRRSSPPCAGWARGRRGRSPGIRERSYEQEARKTMRGTAAGRCSDRCAPADERKFVC